MTRFTKLSLKGLVSLSCQCSSCYAPSADARQCKSDFLIDWSVSAPQNNMFTTEDGGEQHLLPFLILLPLEFTRKLPIKI